MFRNLASNTLGSIFDFYERTFKKIWVKKSNFQGAEYVICKGLLFGFIVHPYDIILKK